MGDFDTLSLSRNPGRFPKLGSEKDNRRRLDVIEQRLGYEFVRKPWFQTLGIKTDRTGRINEISADLVQAGSLKSTNWGVSTGSLFDLNSGTFRLGGSDAPKFSFDGSTLLLTGSMTIVGGSVAIGTSPNWFKVDSQGNFWTGAATYASAPLKGSNTGILIAAGVTINGALTTGAGSSIGGGYITSLSIQTGSIVDLAITAGKIANSTITVNQIANLTITGGKLANGTVTGVKIDSLTITDANIANLTISGGKIANATIDTAKIISLNADKINAGTITAMTIIGSTLQTGTSGENVNITASQLQCRTNSTVTVRLRGGLHGGSLELGIGGAELLNLHSYVAGFGPYIGTGGGLYMHLSNGAMEIAACQYLKTSLMICNVSSVEGSDGAGFFNVRRQSANPSASASNFVRMYFDGSDNLKFIRSNGQTAYVNLSTGGISTWA